MVLCEVDSWVRKMWKRLHSFQGRWVDKTRQPSEIHVDGFRLGVVFESVYGLLAADA
jgi:hypothetical protein